MGSLSSISQSVTDVPSSVPTFFGTLAPSAGPSMISMAPSGAPFGKGKKGSKGKKGPGAGKGKKGPGYYYDYDYDYDYDYYYGGKKGGGKKGLEGGFMMGMNASNTTLDNIFFE